MSIWTAVLDHYTGGYSTGFDKAHAYEFRRAGSEDVQTYRLCEQPPYFNVAGLQFRKIGKGAGAIT